MKKIPPSLYGLISTAQVLVDTPVSIGLQILRMNTLPLLPALLLHAPRFPLEALRDVGMLKGRTAFKMGASRGKVVRRVPLRLMRPNPFAQPHGPVPARRLHDALHACLLVALAAILNSHPLLNIYPLVPRSLKSVRRVDLATRMCRGSPKKIVDLRPYVRVLLTRESQALGDRLAVLDGSGPSRERGRDERVRGITHLDDPPIRARPFRLRVAPADFPSDEPLRGDLPDCFDEHGIPAFWFRKAV